MKQFLSVFFQIIGFGLVVAFGVNLFTFFLMNDALWLMMLTGGIAIFFIGVAFQEGLTKDIATLIILPSICTLIISFAL